MAVVLSGNAVFFIVPMAIVAALPSMAKTFADAGSANGMLQAQMVLIISALSSIIGSPTIALAARFVGKKRALMAMFLLYSVSGSVGVFETGFLPLMVSRAVLGFAGGAIGSLTVVLLADYYEGALRFRLLGISGTIQMATAILSMSLCGWLVDKFGWGFAFIVYPAVGLIMLALAWFAISEPIVSSTAQGLSGKRINYFRDLATVYPAYGVILVLAIGLFMVPIQGPFLLASIHVVNATTQGMIAAAPNITAMISGLLFGYLRNRYSERFVVFLAAGTLGIFTIVSSLANNVQEIVACYLIVGLAVGLIVPAGFGMVIGRASTGVREAAVGMILSVIGIAQFVNPLLCAPIIQSYGIRSAFVGVGGLVLIMLLFLIVGRFGDAQADSSSKSNIMA